LEQLSPIPRLLRHLPPPPLQISPQTSGVAVKKENGGKNLENGGENLENGGENLENGGENLERRRRNQKRKN
jgi:hypothetical protein